MPADQETKEQAMKMTYRENGLTLKVKPRSVFDGKIDGLYLAGDILKAGKSENLLAIRVGLCFMIQGSPSECLGCAKKGADLDSKIVIKTKSTATQLQFVFNYDGSISPLKKRWRCLGLADPAKLGDESEIVLVDVHDNKRKINFDLPRCIPVNGVPDVQDYAEPFKLNLRPDSVLGKKAKHVYMDETDCKNAKWGGKHCNWLRYGNSSKALSVYFDNRSVRLEDDLMRSFYVEKHKVKYEANVFVFHSVRCAK